MAEIVNLRRARKQVARREDEAKAERNRLAFGRTKAEKLTNARQQANDAHRLDGHRLEGRGPARDE